MQKELPQYYTVLFNAVTDAIDLIASKREQEALTILPSINKGKHA